MKKLLIKFSDERNRKYSIQTLIAEDEITKQRCVIKSNIYPEGKEHMDNIVQNAQILSESYTDVKICPVQLLKDHSLKFDYIDGISMESKYRYCVEQNERAELEKLFQKHKRLILGNNGNNCVFKSTPSFEQFFGDHNWKENQRAVKVANFDATASNIIWQGTCPVFIDYEWVFKFPVPEDLLIYHCIADAYYHIEELEKFYPLKDVLFFLGVNEDFEKLERAYKNFHAYVIREKNGTSFGLSKCLNLKGKKDFSEFVNEEKRAQEGWEQCAQELLEMSAALEFAEKNWKEACQANALLAQKLELKKQEVDQIKKLKDEYVNQSENWRIAYETTINSRSWKLIKRLKRIIGKK